MYRNTMYIPTITSWLQSQWQSYIATKSHLWVPLSQQFSSRQRTPKNNTEYRTSVQQKLLCYNNNKENSEKKQTQKRFFTVTVCDKSRDKLTETQNSKQQFNLILDIFYTWTDVAKLHTLHYNGIQIFKIITVIVPLQKFRQRTSQRSYYERSQ
jgi:hypothetical protein